MKTPLKTKFLFRSGLCAGVLALAALDVAFAASACPAGLNATLPRLQDEKPQSICQYEGKVILAVNTASYCGFTYQYKALEAVYAKYQAEGLVVLGFPSNDFQQEKGSDKEIAEFCENTFCVKFPMLSASHVKGDQANPFFKLLFAQGATPPRWNFYKYLIGRDGKLIDSYNSTTEPDGKSLSGAIEKALKAKP